MHDPILGGMYMVAAIVVFIVVRISFSIKDNLPITIASFIGAVTLFIIGVYFVK